MRDDGRGHEQEDRDHQLVERELLAKGDPVDHRGDQHAPDAQRRGLGGRVQPGHRLRQLHQPDGAHKPEEARDEQQRGDQDFGQKGHSSLTR
jgi:hypothetical protein